MRKIFSIIMSIMLVLFILGCAKQAEEPSEQVAPSTVAAETPADEIASGITDITSADEDFDSSGLDGLDSVLGDIERI